MRLLQFRGVCRLTLIVYMCVCRVGAWDGFVCPVSRVGGGVTACSVWASTVGVHLRNRVVVTVGVISSGIARGGTCSWQGGGLR